MGTVDYIRENMISYSCWAPFSALYFYVDVKIMWNGKMKAVTFSYDDGVWQDRRLVELFNKYGLKATFNLNSGLFGRTDDYATYFGKTIRVDTVKPEEVRSLYQGHEVAAHTLTHPNLTECTDDEIIRQVEQDRLRLSELVGYEVVGMAYPCGGKNNDDRVASVIKANTGISYARTISQTLTYDMPKDLHRMDPTIYHLHDAESGYGMSARMDTLMQMGKDFISLQTDEPKMLYVWGHSYEFDLFDGAWERFEEFCTMISGKDDIFYGTNKEILINSDCNF